MSREGESADQLSCQQIFCKFCARDRCVRLPWLATVMSSRKSWFEDNGLKLAPSPIFFFFSFLLFFFFEDNGQLCTGYWKRADDSTHDAELRMWNDIRGSLSKPRRNGNENVTEQKQSNGYTRALCTFRSRPLQTTTWNDQVMPILEYLSHGWVAPPTPTHHSKRTQILGLGTTVATSHNLGTTPDKWAFSPMSRNMNNFSFFSYKQKPTPIDCGLLSSDPKYLQYFIRQPAHILFIVRGFNFFSFLSFFPFCLWFIYWFRTCLVSSKSDGCKKWWLILSSVGRTNTAGLCHGL